MRFSSQDSGSVGGRQKINMQICVLRTCHCRSFSLPFFFSTLVLLLSSMLQLSAETVLAKGKVRVSVELWLGAGFQFSVDCVQLALEMPGRESMAPIVWAYSGEAGAFPGPCGLEYAYGPSLSWGLLFCLVGPGIRLASLWGGGGALIRLTHPHCFLPQI